MAYLKDFRERIQNNDYPGFLKIWEEYCYGDQPDGEEMMAVLESVKIIRARKIIRPSCGTASSIMERINRSKIDSWCFAAHLRSTNDEQRNVSGTGQ